MAGGKEEEREERKDEKKREKEWKIGKNGKKCEIEKKIKVKKKEPIFIWAWVKNLKKTQDLPNKTHKFRVHPMFIRVHVIHALYDKKLCCISNIVFIFLYIIP